MTALLPHSIYRGEDHGVHWTFRVSMTGRKEMIRGTEAEIDAKVLEWRTERHRAKGSKGW